MLLDLFFELVLFCVTRYLLACFLQVFIASLGEERLKMMRRDGASAQSGASRGGGAASPVSPGNSGCCFILRGAGGASPSLGSWL